MPRLLTSRRLAGSNSGENTRRLPNTRSCFTSVEPIYLLNALLSRLEKQKQTSSSSQRLVVSSWRCLHLHLPHFAYPTNPSCARPLYILHLPAAACFDVQPPRHYRASQAEQGRASLDHPSYCAPDIQTDRHTDRQTYTHCPTLRPTVLASCHLRHPLAISRLETLLDKAPRLR
jgi:hypothetical protein